MLEFMRIARDETSAERWMRILARKIDRKGVKNGREVCPDCGERKRWKLRRGHYKCVNCRLEYTPFSGTLFDRSNIGFRTWLVLIKLFELELSARQAAKEAQVSYATAHRAFRLIREAILYEHLGDERLLSGSVELDESYFGGRRKGKRGRGAAGKVPVFGILERDGIVTVEVVPDVSAETLVGITEKKVRRGSIVYTDKFRGYDSLMFCGYRHLKVDHSKKFADGKVYINGLEGFWSFAKQRLAKFHGVSPTNFPSYLKEMEWRYNHRNSTNTFELLVICLFNLKWWL
jgi:transposase